MLKIKQFCNSNSKLLIISFHFILALCGVCNCSWLLSFSPHNYYVYFPYSNMIDKSMNMKYATWQASRHACVVHSA